MPAKQLRDRESARRTMLVGVERLAKAAKVMLGPEGRYVVLDKPWGAPSIAKDGIAVAKEIKL
jgi:chaperonin GroEL